MLKKIFAATAVVAALGISAGPAAAENVCVDVYLDVNGTVQTINECV